MRKPDKNFRMPKAFKNMLGGIKDTGSRHLWKHSFIQAALSIEDYRKTKVKDRGE